MAWIWLRKTIVGAVFGALALPAGAQTTAAREPSGALNILFENDIFFGTDRDYTNGVELSYTTPPSDNVDAIVDFAQAMPLFANHGDVRTSYSLGQSIFTPNHTDLAVPLPTERPYAGFLYATLALLEANPDRLDQLQVQVGVVGPMSLAKETQDWVHGILGDVKPSGWHYQLHNEPAFNLYYDRAFKIIPPQSVLGLVLDVEPHIGGAAGTVYDYADGGAMVRLGFNLPDDFGPPRIEPSVPGSSFFEPTGGFSLYAFAGVDVRAVARNIFLDGNTWRDSPSVDKYWSVGDLTTGVAMTFSGMRIAFTHVFRTKEYKTQTKADQFGAVNVSFRL